MLPQQYGEATCRLTIQFGAILLMLFGGMSGCGRAVNKPSSFGRTRIVKQRDPDSLKHEVPPTLKINHVESVIGCTKPFEVTIDIELAPGTEKPGEVMIALLQGKRVEASSSATEVERTGANSYILSATLKAPKKPGEYTIRAEAIQSILYQPDSPAKKSELFTQRTFTSPSKVKLIK